MRPDELVKEILVIVNTLREQHMEQLSGDTLSRLAVKLASYKASLGEHVSYAKRLQWDAEATYEARKAEAYKQLRDEGKGVGDASAMKAIEANEAYMAWNEAREQATLIATLHDDCHSLIEGIKSRLINLQSERNTSNVF